MDTPILMFVTCSFWLTFWLVDLSKGGDDMVSPRIPRILGVTPRPPLDLDEYDGNEEEIATSFRAAGSFSYRVSREVRTIDEVHRNNRMRRIGLGVSFVFSVGMSVGFTISFGWLWSVPSGLIGILSLALIVWLRLPSSRSSGR